jgi:hypothetical protein
MSFSQQFDSLFAPMDKRYCNVFYGLSIFYFIFMITSIISLIFLFKDVRKNKFIILNSVIMIGMLGINYIYNRLLFNMCGK